jgi:hypothetical protein
VGQLTLPASGVVYVDTSAVIYRVERIEPYYPGMKVPHKPEAQAKTAFACAF